MELRNRKTLYALPKAGVGTESQAFVKLKADEEKHKPTSQMKYLFGFDGLDNFSFNSFVSWLHSPRDPSSLGILRIVFGKYFRHLFIDYKIICSRSCS